MLEEWHREESIELALDPRDRVWNDLVTREGRGQVQRERAVGRLVDNFLREHLHGLKGGKLSSSHHATFRWTLQRFRDWLGAETSVEVINEEKWRDWYEYVKDQGLSVDSQRKMFGQPRTFVAWLGDMGYMTPPRNLYRRQYRFEGDDLVIVTMTVEEVRSLVKEATGLLKLFLLLMVNTGMQQVDISDLVPSEVDWHEGRIRRQRSKLKKRAKTRKTASVIDYQLWPPTWELFQVYGRRDGDRVFIKENGQPWLIDWTDDQGKRHKTDSINGLYDRLSARLGIKKPMKAFRKTSSSKLDRHTTYGRYVYHFLGDKPPTIVQKHYVVPSPEQFDEAVAWLGREYGFMPGA